MALQPSYSENQHGFTGSTSQPPFGSVEPGPVYHEVNPKYLLATKISGGITLIMVVLAFIFCLVQGSHDSNLYLLACNILVSSFIGLVHAWWYKTGDLAADKFWYMILLAGVICFQCLATDIFVFNVDSSSSTPASTLRPPVTRRPPMTTPIS